MRFNPFKTIITAIVLCCFSSHIFASITVNFSKLSLGNNHFSFIASSTPAADSTKYYWDFGDGSSFGWTTDIIANHTFLTTGSYNVKLIGENSIGERDSIVLIINANRYSTALNADFSYSPTSIHLGDSVTFQNTSTTSNGTTVAQWWQIDNLSYTESASATTESFSYIFRSTGIFKIMLTVRNSNANYDTTIKCINVLPPNTPLKANFFFSPSPAIVGSQLQFTDISYTASGAITSWRWEFGDNSPVLTTQNPTHTYSAEGNYNTTLIITNSLGQSDTIVKHITISPLNQSKAIVCPNSNYYLYAAYSGNSYQWQESTDTGRTYHNISNNSNFWGVSRYNLLILNPPTSWYGYKYRCVTDIGIGEETALVFQNSYSSSTGEWGNPAKWSCGIVPDMNTDVVISSGTVTVNSNAVCRSLTILPGANLIVANGYNLTVLH